MPAPRGRGARGAAAAGALLVLLLVLLGGAGGLRRAVGGGEGAAVAGAPEPGRPPSPPCGGLPGRGSCELRRLRARLREGRAESPLFDGARWTADFETGLLMAQELQAAGLPPAHLFVASGRTGEAPAVAPSAAAAGPSPGLGRPPRPPSVPEL